MKLQKINCWSNFVKSFIYYNVKLEYITIKVFAALYTKQIQQERKIEKKLPGH